MLPACALHSIQKAGAMAFSFFKIRPILPCNQSSFAALHQYHGKKPTYTLFPYITLGIWWLDSSFKVVKESQGAPALPTPCCAVLLNVRLCQVDLHQGDEPCAHSLDWP